MCTMIQALMLDEQAIEFLLSATSSLGPLTLGLILFLSPLGLPFPAALLVLATGAFVRLGLVDWRLALFLALLGAVLGDCTAYALGRALGGWARNPKRRWAKAWHRAEAFLARHGGLAVYTTRFLFPALDVPINLLAGGSRLAFHQFLASATAGRATWIVLYGGLGYASGSQWEAAGQVAATSASWVGILAIAGLLAYALLRRWLPAGGSYANLEVKIEEGGVGGGCRAAGRTRGRPVRRRSYRGRRW
jgi:membrane-associated protein